ncbi:MAG: hypothetical protein P8K05_05890 [Dehalococcoidia bacterium]|nr:hypothetical protein [Dehalococcoidia bacterium]
MNLFDEVMKNTQVILNPKNLISTYNQTKVRYHIVTEPSYNQNSIKNSEESVIRHGVVTAHNPKVITPDFLYRMSGFGDEAKSYLKELNKVFDRNEPALLYSYKNESTDLEIVSGNPVEVSERIKKRLVNKSDNHTVIRGVNSLWDVSLFKFIFDYTKQSSKNNFEELNKSGLLEIKDGVPLSERKRIEELFNQAKQGKVRFEDVHKELDEWGLFEEYQDQFFSLLK